MEIDRVIIWMGGGGGALDFDQESGSIIGLFKIEFVTNTR